MPLNFARRLLMYPVLALLLGAALPSRAGTAAALMLAQRPYAASHERQFKVYVPDVLSGPAPMVMALHGCRQTHVDVLRDWGLVAAADRHRFILVVPVHHQVGRPAHPQLLGLLA